MASRRKRGLCYNCSERYGPNHCSRAKFFLLISSEDDDDTQPPDPPDLSKPISPPPPPTDHNPAQLSLHALLRHPASTTFRVVGTIHAHDVIILVDSGSTHNFVHDRLAHFLHLRPQSIPALAVMVGNDTEIKCDKVCRDVTVTIQGRAFTLDLHVMALGGTNIVLGMAWLKLLGLVTTDYSHLTMSFKHNGEPITIHDNVDLGPFEIHHGQVRHLVNTHRIAALFHIQLQEHSPTPSGSPFTPPLLRLCLPNFPTFSKLRPSSQLLAPTTLANRPHNPP